MTTESDIEAQTDRATVLIRSFVLERAETEGDGRSLLIRAVPYDYEAQVASDVWENFAPGAFDHQLPAMHRVKLTLGHPKVGQLLTDSLIGLLSNATGSDQTGLQLHARMATTTTAGEALALVNDGVLDEVSIGFRALATERSKRAAGGTLLRRTKAQLDHVALVPAGAYGDGAKVLSVRDNDGPTLADLRALAARLDQSSRK